MKVVWTDGSAAPNPGPGGFAVIDGETGEPLILGRSDESTNNRMEGEAMLAAMTAFPEVEIHSDSSLWINILTQWAQNWKERGWHKKGGIQNLDLVQRLYDKYENGKVRLVWVQGHFGIDLNEVADEWANRARERETFRNLEILEVPKERELLEEPIAIEKVKDDSKKEEEKQLKLF